MNISIGEVQNIVSNSGITKYVDEMKGLRSRGDRQIYVDEIHMEILFILLIIVIIMY
jgi:hypothetical protein